MSQPQTTQPFVHTGLPEWPMPTPLRRPGRECDRALNGTARQWLRALPPRRRPLKLCEHFPRVANRLAFCWRDPDLARQTLDDLLVDRRGGRTGFPAPVVRELRRLAEFNDQQRVDAAANSRWGWDAVKRLARFD